VTRRFDEDAVPVPVHRLFTYAVDDAVAVGPGHRVRVRFGPQRKVGVVVRGPLDAPPAGLDPARVRPVEEVLDAAPVVGGDLLALAGWLADYYYAAPGEAYLLPLPPGMGGGRSGRVRELATRTEHVARFVAAPAPGKAIGARMDQALSWLSTVAEATSAEVREATGADLQVLRRLAERGLVALAIRDVPRDPFAALRVTPDTPPPLTPEQVTAVATVAAALGTFQGFLLHGVTGSGKTEVYLQLIAEVLARGQGALVLVPEIALTPQLVARFRARLGERIAVQHSRLDPAARHEQWLRIASGELSVVIGARSALFAPIADLGLIVVDEEHESSFKQDTAPRYNARDLALVRGRLVGAPVLLGSATPALESWANVSRGKLTRVPMTSRVQERPLPAVELVDMRTAAPADEERLFSAPLMEAVHANLARGEQTILFLNRRGFAAFVMCRSCGETATCPSCDVSFTWHRARRRLVCHYCDNAVPLPPVCPSCQDDAMQEIGFGTERVLAVLADALPASARVARMDRDTTRGSALTTLLDSFRRRELDILVGTQMVAKGHDFPDVTLVGVLLAEQSLRLPDFRASERTFQLMTQMAGRAGRADKPGRVMIQTYLPEHYALRYATEHDTVGFLTDELERRRHRAFPPWGHLILVRVDGPRRDQVEATARRVTAMLTAVGASPGASGPAVLVMGPSPAPIERIKDRFRFQVLVSSAHRGPLRDLLVGATEALDIMKLPSAVSIGIDVDPLNFL
jgi:primosomal protein N' (replication factor Y)